MANFSKDGKVPFPRTKTEWEAAGYTPEAAEHKVAQDVFGHDYKKDANGVPIETGKGSKHQQTAAHQIELQRTQDAEIARKMRLGWHPDMDRAPDPRKLPDRPRKKPGRKPAAAKAAPSPPPSAA